MRPTTLITFLILSSPIFADDHRTWKNTDGTNSFNAEFVKQEKNLVTLRQQNGRLITFDISKLHQNDREWLQNRTAPDKPITPKNTLAKNTVFDTLQFGDSRATVTKKLEESKMVSTEIKSIFFGRTGLNGIFHTKNKIGGLHCYLFFDWDENDTLKEVTLQTESKELAEYKTVLNPCWTELIEIINTIHGNPIQHMDIINPSLLQDGQMMATHLWRLENDGTVMLGTSQTATTYQVFVRFTKDKIEPNIVPAK